MEWLNGLKNKTHTHIAYNRLTPDVRTHTEMKVKGLKKDFNTSLPLKAISWHQIILRKLL